MYKEIDTLLDTIHLPVIVLTTTVGVSLMFDWEAAAYMKSKGLQVFNPHSVELAKTVFRALALKREMKHQKFLIFQDTPGDGLIPEQFKIFYWWNEECTRSMQEKFGITIVRKSYKALGEKAKSISDEDARRELSPSASVSSLSARGGRCWLRCKLPQRSIFQRYYSLPCMEPSVSGPGYYVGV